MQPSAKDMGQAQVVEDCRKKQAGGHPCLNPPPRLYPVKARDEPDPVAQRSRFQENQPEYPMGMDLRTQFSSRVSCSNCKSTYICYLQDKTLHLSAAQFKEMKKEHPLLWCEEETQQGYFNKRFRYKIQRRLSKRYRDHQAGMKANRILREKGYHGQELPYHEPMPNITGAINRLITEFVLEVKEKGDAGLPPLIKSQDPEVDDVQFYSMV